jgi:tricorn protease
VNDKGQLLYIRAADDGLPSVMLYEIEDGKGKEKSVISGVTGFLLTSDGKKMLTGNPGAGMAIVSAAPGQSLAKTVNTSQMKMTVSPREEWRQLFTDAWRVQRDFFYDEGLHGVDWAYMRDRYGAMIEDCATREDVSFVIRELISELNVGHAYYSGGDVEDQPSRNVGLLGCDFELASTDEGSAYRIRKIYRGAPWDTDAVGPLSRLGVDVKEGDFLLEVNGIAVDTARDPWLAFLGTAGQVTMLTVSDKPVRDDTAREVLVEPVSNDANLRYRNRIEQNRAYVDYKSGGKVGYIYVPNTGVNGQNDLFRQFYGQREKQALIIDERWNGGGQIPTRFIELLNRPRTNYWARRDGKDWPWPPDSHQGPKCMLINGLAGSGGDMFPALFKQTGLGKLIGTRTWGGLVGISGNPGLIDGGSVTAPTFGYYETDGTWGIEGHGVDPDIEVLDDPALMVGAPEIVADPQLDAAIELMQAEIQRTPYVRPARPASPDRRGMGIREEDK